jgi:hypothetical protein
MKNNVLIFSILIFTIIYGTSCEKDNYTTELTFENLKGNWEQKSHLTITWLFFESENELRITRNYLGFKSQYDYYYYLDTTSNIYMRPKDDYSDTLPYIVCPIKFVNTSRIRITNFPTTSEEDITFVRD